MDPNLPYSPNLPTPPQEPLPPYVPSQTPVVSPVNPQNPPVLPPKQRFGLNFIQSIPRWIRLSLIGLFVVVVVAVVAFIVISYKPKKAPVITPPAAKQLCFVRLGYLDCVDSSGENRVRFDLPSLPQNARITSLVSSTNQSGFLAVSPNSEGTESVWTITASMQVGQQVLLPSGDFGATPSWSNDNKSVLLDINGAAGSRQIGRYTISTQALQMLTTSGFNTNPYETNDGHIVYYHSADGKTNWQVYIMKNDGSTPQPLGNLTSLGSVLGLSYDAASDTILAFGSDTSNNPTITYGTTVDFLEGRVVKVLAVPAVSNGDQVAFINSNSLILSNGTLAYILNLNSKGQSTIIRGFGNLVGMLTTTLFHKSSQQTEQPYERIVNLSTAPQDFAPFIEKQFNTGDQACSAIVANQNASIEFQMLINQTVSDSFASVTQGCDTMSTIYYFKDSGGNWAKAFVDQGTPTCAQVNQFDNFTSQIIPQCYNAKNQLIANPNP